MGLCTSLVAVTLEGRPPFGEFPDHAVVPLRSGRVVALYGQNGAGKTRALDGVAAALLGEVPADPGGEDRDRLFLRFDDDPAAASWSRWVASYWCWRLGEEIYEFSATPWVLEGLPDGALDLVRLREACGELIEDPTLEALETCMYGAYMLPSGMPGRHASAYDVDAVAAMATGFGRSRMLAISAFGSSDPGHWEMELVAETGELPWPED